MLLGMSCLPVLGQSELRGTAPRRSDDDIKYPYEGNRVAGIPCRSTHLSPTDGSSWLSIHQLELKLHL